MLSVVPRRRLWYLCSGVFVGASVLALVLLRLNVGIDFTGGSLTELTFAGERPTSEDLARRFADLDAERVLVQPSGERGAIVRSAALPADAHGKIVAAFNGEAIVERFETIGPAIGRELARRTAWGVLLALVLIAAYVAWMFRKAGQAVTPWAYGVVALIAMAHDVLIPLGVFAVLGRVAGVEIGATFIAALLTILGYSINDTIIVLDRVRENVGIMRAPFAEVVEASIRQSFARSVNTTLTTLLALLAVILVGGATIRPFALALALGIGIGAYSSIFVAAPLLVTWQQRRKA